MRHSKIILGTSTILAASALTAAASQYVNPNIEGFQENSDTEEEINILYDTDTEDTSNAEVVTVADTDDTQVDSADPGGAVYVTLPIAADTATLTASAVWYDVTIDATLNGGTVDLDVWCIGDENGMVDTSGNADYTFSIADGTSSFWLRPSVSPDSTSPGTYFCHSGEAAYRLRLDADGASSIPVVNSVTLNYLMDVDSDGWPGEDPGADEGTEDGDGFIDLDGQTWKVDCDDDDDAINPGNEADAEVAGNNVDEDCDDAVLCYVDADHDTFGSTTTQSTTDCTATGFSVTNNDINDAATSCGSTGAGDEDGDGIQDCIDRCDSVDRDDYGETRNTAVGNALDTRANCDVVAGGAACTFTGDAAACLGTDVDDNATTCTTSNTNADNDGVLDCRDQCLDADLDRYGNGNAPAAACLVVEGGAACTFSADAVACLGADINDAATSCTNNTQDLDQDGEYDCIDLCLDQDEDEYGVTHASTTVIGTGAVAVTKCRTKAGTGTDGDCVYADATCTGQDCYDNDTPTTGQGVLRAFSHNGTGALIDPASVNPGVTDVCGDGVINSCASQTMCTNMPCTAAQPITTDDDLDTLSNGSEHTAGTDICDTDTDNDGIRDDREIAGRNNAGTLTGFGATSPIDSDSDNDGIRDDRELAGQDAGGVSHGHGATNPNNWDSDADYLPDGLESGIQTAQLASGGLSNGTCATYCARTFTGTTTTGNVTDLQTWWTGPGASLSTEKNSNTDPNDPDSDDDSLCDGPAPGAVVDGSHDCNDRARVGGTLKAPTSVRGEDLDRDGLVNGSDTDPNDADSDNDNLCDDTFEGTGTAPCVGSEITAGTLAFRADSDNDGRNDGLEDKQGDGNVGQSGTQESNPKLADSDKDGRCDGSIAVTSGNAPENVACAIGEFTAGTDPMRADTDGDGLCDGTTAVSAVDAPEGVACINGEISRTTNPLRPDTDNDGLSDRFEFETLTTLPIDNDHDDDGIIDGIEDDAQAQAHMGTTTANGYVTTGTVQCGLGQDPRTNNCWQADGNTATATDPKDADTDNDGICDGSLAVVASNCVSGEDMDNDGAVDITAGSCTESSPLDADSDEDGIIDGTEKTYTTNALLWDHDGDGLSDGQEMGLDSGVAGGGTTYPFTGTETVNLTASVCGKVIFKADANNTHDTDPLAADTDRDGLCDGNSSPGAVCVAGEDRDNDGLVDAGESDPRDRDSDNDGIDDGDEDPNGNGYSVTGLETDPNNQDTDGDGLHDGEETGVTTGYANAFSIGTSFTQVEAHGSSDTTGGDAAKTFNPDGNSTQGSDPVDADSDGDGLCDGNLAVTHATFGTCTIGEDTNMDGIVQATESDPLDADSDNDGLADKTEATGQAGYAATLKLDEDSDNDTLIDGMEVGVTAAVAGGTSRKGITFHGSTDTTGNDAAKVWVADADNTTTTNPNNPDSDNDDLCDGPTTIGTTCFSGFGSTGEDANKNGRVDTGETNPNDDDSDNDNLTDGLEELTVCNNTFTANPAQCANPLVADTDADNVRDDLEAFTNCAGVQQGTLQKANCDTDSLINVLDNDDDGDSILTKDEDWTIASGQRAAGNNNPLDNDRDGDTVWDYLDNDDDGDDVPTIEDACGGGALATTDTDGNSWPDYLDNDDDGDFSPTFIANQLAWQGSLPTNAYLALTMHENLANTDPCEVDSDADGVPDGTEFGKVFDAPRDTDNDGTIDALDNDDDGDGINTIAEDDGTGWNNNQDRFPALGGVCDGEAELDGTPIDAEPTPDYLDPDSDNDGVCDGSFDPTGTPFETVCDWFALVDRDGADLKFAENNADNDKDGIPNYFDCDDLDGDSGDPDLDGLPSGDEYSDDGSAGFCFTSPGTCPGDARLNTVSECCLNSNNPDTDEDCINDGVEKAAGDNDSDGLPDAFDDDDDDDRILTADEYYTGAWVDCAANDTDTRCTETRDGYWDFSITGGVVDTFDASTCDPRTINTSHVGPNDIDTDNDGIPDYIDEDDDNDGILTEDELGPNGELLDGDDDELPDYLDHVANGRCGDADGDGVTNVLEEALGLDSYSIDSDNDGVPDQEELWAATDACGAYPLPDANSFDPAECTAVPSYDDSCFTITCCGATPNSDDDSLINALDADDDGDGLPTRVEGAGDADGDGVPNYLDDDSDEDGATDAAEGGSTFTTVEALPDADGDGIPDFLDAVLDAFDTGDGGNEFVPTEPGCACSSTPSTPITGLWGLLLGGLMIRRRRMAA